MNKLTEEQKDIIIEEYGSSKEIIKRIEDIMYEFNFNEDDYFELIASIASEYETNSLNEYFVENNYISESNLYTNLKEIIEKVLKYKQNNFSEKEISYKLINKVLKKTMNTKYI